MLVTVGTSTLHRFRAAGHVATASPVVVVVQDMIATGRSGLIEDTTTPAYLSSKPIPSCSSKGCEIPQTQMSSGVVLQATCKIQGARMTNENLASAGIAHNKGGIISSLWYRCIFANGAAGYLSEVYVAAAYRGGLGLPTC